MKSRRVKVTYSKITNRLYVHKHGNTYFVKLKDFNSSENVCRVGEYKFDSYDIIREQIPCTYS